jgi:hypothetical protein
MYVIFDWTGETWVAGGREEGRGSERDREMEMEKDISRA